MISVLAQVGSEVDFYQWIVRVVGILVAVLGFAKIPLLLDQEFSPEEDQIKDPIAWTVSSGINFDKFKENNWKAFQALCAAMQLRNYIRRFNTFLTPATGIPMYLLSTFIMIVCYVFARDQKLGSNWEGLVVGCYALSNVSWIVLIEHGKSLKRAAVRLRSN